MSETTDRSPRIEQIVWGRMEIEGVGSGSDFKLWPGGGRAWDWTETGMHHSPGIGPADVEELLLHGSRIVVLGRGFELRLQVDAETIEYLRRQAVESHALPSEAAVELYNRLAAAGEPVGGLFHSTC